jgi:hypothetical protein
MLHRRAFLLGLTSLVAAPAIVKADSIMRIKPLSDAWVHDVKWDEWRQESSSIVITNKTIKDNHDVFDMDVWTNLSDMISKPNAWLDIIADRIRSGEERDLMKRIALREYSTAIPKMENNPFLNFVPNCVTFVK